jgi:hypothetical protein
MVVVGPLSIWVELYSYALPPDPDVSVLTLGPPVFRIHSLDALRTALLTFFPAVAATTAMQLVWAEGKEMRSFAVLILAGVGVATALIYPHRVPDAVALSVGVVLTVLALWFWWVANARNADFLGQLNPADSVGGNILTAPLEGNLKGFDAGGDI